MTPTTHIPTACLELRPTSQSIKLAGVYISLVAVCDKGGFDHGYLSHIVAGKRWDCRLSYFMRIANCLGMSVDGLIVAIKERELALESEYGTRSRLKGRWVS